MNTSWQALWEQTAQVVGPYLPRLIAAAGILVVGWLVAMLLATVVRAVLKRTTVDDRLAGWIAGEDKVKAIDLEALIAKSVYYLAMLFVLVAFFQTLGLTLITDPLNNLLNRIFTYAPSLLAGAALVLIAWLLATVIRVVVVRLLGATQIDEKLSSGAGLKEDKKVPLAKSVGDALYWLVFLLFLPAILGTLGLHGILEPIQGMMNKLLGFLPNMLAAALILAVGWFLARVVRQIVTNLLMAAGLDGLGEKVGLTGVLGGQKLSGLLGLVVYILILVPVLISSLNTLGLDSITEPASNMLNMLLAAVPSIFGAALLLVLAYVLAKVVSGLIANILAGVGFDRLPAKLGIGIEPAEDRTTSSQVVGSLVLVGIMLFAAIEAANLLGFESLAVLLAEVVELAGHVLLGLVIFGVGLYLANVADTAIRATFGDKAVLMAVGARVAIILLTGAMALRQMGLANEIISLAFGLVVGAAAVAIAIAFGIGGRDLASRQLESWMKSMNSGGDKAE